MGLLGGGGVGRWLAVGLLGYCLLPAAEVVAALGTAGLTACGSVAHHRPREHRRHTSLTRSLRARRGQAVQAGRAAARALGRVQGPAVAIERVEDATRAYERVEREAATADLPELLPTARKRPADEATAG